MIAATVASIAVPNLASPQFKANPYPFYARLRAEAPILRVTLPNRRPAWLVSRYDDVLTLLKDERFVKNPLSATAPDGSTKAPWVPGVLKPLARNMLDLDGADHARLRKLVHKAFTPRLIEHLAGRIQDLCDELLDTAQRSGTTIDLIHSYALPIPLTIIAEMLGIPPADRAKFHRWTSTMVSVSSALDVARVLMPVWQLQRYLRQLFEQRRADPRDDLVTALVQAEEAGDHLSEDELLAMVVILLIAGHETTVNMIGNGTLALLQHPDQLDRLRNDPDLTGSAVEEMLRYSSPVELATERYAREDVSLLGATIPRGEMVLGVLASANRDERQFANPDTLDIAREPNRHLAFGQGIHYCLGSPLARLEGRIAFQTLLRRAPNLRLACAPEAVPWHKALFVRGLDRLPVTF
jgi:cytochrome P450